MPPNEAKCLTQGRGPIAHSTAQAVEESALQHRFVPVLVEPHQRVAYLLDDGLAGAEPAHHAGDESLVGVKQRSEPERDRVAFAAGRGRPDEQAVLAAAVSDGRLGALVLPQRQGRAPRMRRSPIAGSYAAGHCGAGERDPFGSCGTRERLKAL